MELFDNLASVGLTTAVLQVLIIGGAILFFIGMFWRYIVAGIGIAFCVAVFAMPSKKNVQPVETITQSVPTIIKQDQVDIIKPEEIKPEAKTEPTERDMFMEDCQKYGNYTESQCVALWNSRDTDEVAYRRATKKMFMLKAKYRYNS